MDSLFGDMKFISSYILLSYTSSSQFNLTSGTETFELDGTTITIETDDTISISEPSTIVLLILGLMGIAISRSTVRY